MRWLGPVIAASGCSFHPPAGDNGAGSDAAMIDASSDATAAKSCWDHWHDGTAQLGTVTSLGIGAGSGVIDRDPWVTPDELSIYFQSNRANPNDADIYVAKRLSTADPFGAPAIPADFGGIDSGANEGKCSMTSDGLLVVFSSDFQSDFDVWQATRATPGAAFSVAPLNDQFLNIDDAQGQFDPDISGDGLELYFASFRQGDTFETISKATRSSRTAAFDSPTRVAELNSNSGDGDPSRSSDGTVIVFSSLRVGVGGVDLWYAVRPTSSGTWGTPAQIPGVNTTNNESDPMLGADGCHLYFASDRGGDYDVFVAAMTP